jgi:hypothetical protein
MATQLGTPLPRQRYGHVYLFAALGAALFTAIGALRGSYGWGLAETFAVLTAFFYVLPWLSPRRRETVQIDDTGVLVVTPKGSDQVCWRDVTRIRILTSSGGPWAEDVYFVLDGTDGSGCIVPHDAATRTRLLEEIQARFPNVDDEKVIAAMGCTAKNGFVIWEATGGRPA